MEKHLWFMGASVIAALFGVMCLVAPQLLHKLNGALNQTFTAVDEQLMRSRYVMGGLLLIAAGCFFYLARLLSS